MDRSQLSERLFPRLILGLEVGTSSLKAVWLRPRAGMMEVFDFAVEELSGEESEREQAFLRIAQKQRAPYLQTFVVFSEGDFYEGASILPLMPEREIEKFLYMSLIEKGGLDLPDPLLKFIVSDVKPTRKKRVVITLAVSLRLWKKRLREIGRSRLSLKALNFSGVSYQNVLPAEERDALLVDIGFQKSDLYLYQSQTLAFVRREARLGSDEVTRAMTMEIATSEGKASLHPEEAELVKRKYGIPPQKTYGHKVRGVSLFEIWSMVRPWADKLVTSIGNALVHYQQNFPPARVGKIYLTGGGAMLPNLQSYLADNLSLPVEMLPVPARLTFASEKLGQGFSRLGPRLLLALAAALDQNQRTNLLPLKNKFLNKLILPLRMLWLILPFLALVTIPLYITTTRQVQSASRTLQQKRETLVSLQEEARQWQQVRRRENDIQSAQEFVRRELRWPDLWVGVAWEISRAIPEGLVLNRLSLKHEGNKGVLHFEGRIITAGQKSAAGGPPEQVLANFTRSLVSSPFFHDVQELKGGVDEAEGDFRFKFNISLRR